MKLVRETLPEIRILRSRRAGNLLILIWPDNGIKIAYRKAASDAQALHRKSQCETSSGRREQLSHEMQPGPERAKVLR
jgi:hypothetical protein